ncbi:MAG TPA: ABC transporter permease subunit [Trebonia sp.]|jgi:NitT/TauT family transport system permease protein
MATDVSPAAAPSKPRRAARHREAARGRRSVAPLRGLLPLAVLLGSWQLIGIAHQSVFFPPPSAWIAQLTTLESSGLWAGVRQTLVTFVLSLVIATIIGIVLGILVGRSDLLDRLLSPTLEFFRFLPGVALVPLAVLFMGYTQSMELYVVVFGAIWPVLLQVRLAAREIDPLLMDVRRSLRLGRLAAFRKIVLPAVAPGAMLGVVITAPLTLVLALVVEISTQVSGIGKLLETAQQSFLAAQVFALIVIVGVIALAVNVLLSLIEGALFRHRPVSR